MPGTDIRPRIYFYVDKGRGILPESGVGGYPHKLVMRNLYDVFDDPLDLVSSQSGKGYSQAERMSAWERAIMQAGFDGYYANDPVMTQGHAVLVGPHSPEVVPATPNKQTSGPVQSTDQPRAVKTRREGNELVRKPAKDEELPLIRLQSEVKKVAPSFRFQWGELRVKGDEADAANAALANSGSTFKFSERTEKTLPSSNLKSFTDNLIGENYAGLDGLEVFSRDDGRNVNAADALRDMDKRLDALRMVRSCLL